MRRRTWIWIGLGVLAFMAAFGLAGRFIEEANQPADPPAAPTVNTDAIEDQEPTVFTYFFYWYDIETMAHLQPESGLPVHLPANPPPTWRSSEWFASELLDMEDTGVDVVLPVYWGTGEEWSVAGLPVLAEAKRQLEADGREAPDIGLFLDTTILEGRDLTQPDGQQFFYENVRVFFEAIPREQWALVDGRPVVWLYFSFLATAFDQSTFDFVYDSFERDFGVRPYIVREVSWDFAKSPQQDVIEEQPIATEANYKWGAALDGYTERGSVAAVGPGFDEREIPGRGDAHRPRDDGEWYRQNFQRAIESGKQLLVIETWNEVHEASGIGATVEYGREYIEATADLVQQFRDARGGEVRRE